MALEHDAATMRRIAAGDHEAFRSLYEAIEKPLFAFILRRLGDPHESADLFHEVMMEIWRGAGRYEGRARLTTWVFGVAHYKTIDLLRKRGRRAWDALEEEPVDESPSAYQQIAAKADAGVLRGCLNRLDPVKREAIALIFSESMKYQEAAAALRTAEGTIKARVHRALGQLRICVTRRGLRATSEGGG